MSAPLPGKPALSITATPYKVVSTARTLSVPGTVTDSGAAPIKVTTAFQSLTKAAKGCHEASPPSWVKVTPSAFTLKPGESQHITITVAAPPGAHGDYDLAAIYSALPVTAATSHGGGVTMSAGVGTRVLVNLGGAANDTHPCLVAVPPVPKAAPIAGPHVGASGFNPVALVLLASVILAALVCIGVAIRRRTRRI